MLMLGVVVTLFLLGVSSIAYFVLYVVMVDLTNVFTFFWMVLGVLCIGGGVTLLLLRHHKVVLPKLVVWGGSVVAAMLLLTLIIVEGLIIGYGHSKPDQGADYVIVLGARVRGEKLTANLSRRLWATRDYMQANPETKAILSGGQGPGEDISEAEAMYRYLASQGIDSDRLIREDQSVNTDQNLRYSRQKMASPDSSTIVVSNDFHIYRALRIAKKQGLHDVQGLGTATKWYTIPNMYMREAFAVIKYTVCRQI